MKCRICDTKCKQFLDLGKQPIANNFVSKSQFDSEVFYNLTVHFCPQCFTIQLGETVPPAKVFNENYSFYTGTSQAMADHFKELAVMINDRFFLPIADKGKWPVMIEIGANDGTFLQHFSDLMKLHDKPTCIGFEPSKSVAEVAKKKGVRICGTPFEKHEFPGVGNWPKTDVIVSANTFAHIEDRRGFLKNIKKVMAHDGVWINEEPYFGNTIDRLAFDQFYNEHVFYTSITSMARTLEMFGLHIDSVEFLWTHGGSIRYFIKHGHADPGPLTAFIYRSIHSNALETDPWETLQAFGEKVQGRIERLQSDLRGLKGPVVGYGAPAKMSTITNACGLGPETISKIYDTTSAKVGKFSPGQHIPIVSHSEFSKDRTKNVVLFVWNHLAEVMAKEGGRKKRGRKWILPVLEY